MATGTDVKTIKGYRPSTRMENNDGAREKEMMAMNIKIYAQRAAAGLPLFKEESSIDRRRKK